MIKLQRLTVENKCKVEERHERTWWKKTSREWGVLFFHFTALNFCYQIIFRISFKNSGYNFNHHQIPEGCQNRFDNKSFIFFFSELVHQESIHEESRSLWNSNAFVHEHHGVEGKPNWVNVSHFKTVVSWSPCKFLKLSDLSHPFQFWTSPG